MIVVLIWTFKRKFFLWIVRILRGSCSAVHFLCLNLVAGVLPLNLCSLQPGTFLSCPVASACSTHTIKAGVTFNYVPRTHPREASFSKGPSQQLTKLIGSRHAGCYWTWHPEPAWPPFGLCAELGKGCEEEIKSQTSKFVNYAQLAGSWRGVKPRTAALNELAYTLTRCDP